MELVFPTFPGGFVWDLGAEFGFPWFGVAEGIFHSCSLLFQRKTGIKEWEKRGNLASRVVQSGRNNFIWVLPLFPSPWFCLIPGIFLSKCFLFHLGPFFWDLLPSGFTLLFFLGNPSFQAGIYPPPMIQVLQDRSSSPSSSSRADPSVCPGVPGAFPVILALWNSKSTNPSGAPAGSGAASRDVLIAWSFFHL